mmetsp:Transcript_27274/g.44427  ORF Transcript_27274/g.44427 Transcript_27274/m.44427 type:complete len:389 (-) Transcript_27274:263-1429(-)
MAQRTNSYAYLILWYLIYYSPARLNLRGELSCGSEGETVNSGWISDVLSPVLNRSLTGRNSLNVESEHGEHSETAVLDLLNLKFSEGIWIVSKSKRIESSTRVDSIKTFSSRTSVHTVSFSSSHKDDLASKDSKNGLSVNKGRVSEVVKSAFSEDLGSSLEPNRLSNRNARVLSKKFRGNASKSSKHSPTSVDNFSLTVSSEGVWVSGKSLSIPSVVSREFTGEVGRNGSLRERAEPESTVRSVPFLASSTSNLLAGNLLSDLRDAHARLDELVGDSSSLDKEVSLRGVGEDSTSLLGRDLLARKSAHTANSAVNHGSRAGDSNTGCNLSVAHGDGADSDEEEGVKSHRSNETNALDIHVDLGYDESVELRIPTIRTFFKPLQVSWEC